MRILLTTLAALSFAAPSAAASSQPNSVQVAVDRFGTWNGEIKSLLDWNDDEPFLDAAICELQNGPMTISFRRGGTSGRRSYPDIWINEEAIAEQRKQEQVEISGLTIGSRSFQIARSDWQVAGWFSNFGYKGDTIIAGGGDPFLTYQESSKDPPLAIGLLLDEMMDAERLRLHYRAIVESRGAGEEAAYGEADLNISHLREAVSWCVEGLESDRILVLPRHVLEPET